MDDNSAQNNTQTPVVSDTSPVSHDTFTLDTPLPAPSVPPPAPLDDTPPPDLSSADSQPNTSGEHPEDSVSPEFREQVYKELAEAMLDGLGTGEIEVEASEDSSEYILPKLDSVQTKNDLLALLQDVANQWPVYQKVYDQYKTAESQTKSENADREKLEAIKDQLHSFKNTD